MVRGKAKTDEEPVSTEETPKEESAEEEKRKADDEDDAAPDAKKTKTDESNEESETPGLDLNPATEPEPIAASTEGTTIFNDADVLSGRGGGTNVHPGNRTFRDLINLHRRAYLKARKNDKPAISRAIVRSIRETNGRFLKKDEKSGLWYEIGDDAAREKTSQALRQRAPEMRKLLFDTEREEARAAAEEHMRQHRMMMMPPPGMTPEMMANMPQMPMGPGCMPMMPNPFFAQMQAQQGKQGNGKNEGGENGQHPPMPPFPMFPFMPFPPPPGFAVPGGKLSMLMPKVVDRCLVIVLMFRCF
jgi:hypothetical protein